MRSREMQASETMGIEAEPVRDPAAPAPDAASVPQIAYAYSYGFRLAADRIARVQAEHVAMCDRLGTGRCRIGEMTRAVWDGSGASGTMTLIVDARIARRFGDGLSAAVSALGGVPGEAGITAEDLSNGISDATARPEAKEALRERLMGHLRTRQGSVADLVAAEHAVAAVQEEIDATRSWLAQARGRVAMSRIDVHYST